MCSNAMAACTALWPNAGAEDIRRGNGRSNIRAGIGGEAQLLATLRAGMWRGGRSGETRRRWDKHGRPVTAAHACSLIAIQFFNWPTAGRRPGVRDGGWLMAQRQGRPARGEVNCGQGGAFRGNWGANGGGVAAAVREEWSLGFSSAVDRWSTFRQDKLLSAHEGRIRLMLTVRLDLVGLIIRW